MPDVMIYVPHGPDSARWLDECIKHCQRHGYTIVAVVAEWSDVIGFVRRGYHGIVVSPPPELLPVNRLPRMEYVGTADPTPPAPPTSGQRRVRRRRQIPGEG